MDQSNGKYTDIERQIMLDTVKENKESIIEMNDLVAFIAKHKFDSLIKAGFTEDQALKMCSTAFIF